MEVKCCMTYTFQPVESFAKDMVGNSESFRLTGSLLSPSISPRWILLPPLFLENRKRKKKNK